MSPKEMHLMAAEEYFIWELIKSQTSVKEL
jgi:hypothetical protein